MGRRRSTSTITRLVQVLFAVFWIGFVVYMVWNYMDPNKGAVVEGANPESPADRDIVVGVTPPVVSASTDPLVTPKTTTTPLAPTGPSAQQVLDSTLAAYRNARAYSDRGKLEVSWQTQGRAPFVAVSYTHLTLPTKA